MSDEEENKKPGKVEGCVVNGCMFITIGNVVIFSIWLPWKVLTEFWPWVWSLVSDMFG